MLEENYLLRNYPNLQAFSTEIEKQLEWKETLEKIKQNGIKVLLNDIYEF